VQCDFIFKTSQQKDLLINLFPSLIIMVNEDMTGLLF
jgi:hypothetical protein